MSKTTRITRRAYLRLHPLDATPSELVEDLALARCWSRAHRAEERRLRAQSKIESRKSKIP